MCVAAPDGWAVATGHGRPQSRHHPRHADADRQLAQQPHRLDPQPRRAGRDPGALSQHRHLGVGRRGVRAPVLRNRHGQWLCLVFSGCGRARRPPGRGAQLFQELFDDRLATGLVGHARCHDAPHGQTDRVQHLVRLGVHPTRRGGGLAKHRRHHTPCGGSPQSLSRHPGATAAIRAGRSIGPGPWRYVRVFQARRSP